MMEEGQTQGDILRVEEGTHRWNIQYQSNVWVRVSKPLTGAAFYAKGANEK